MNYADARPDIKSGDWLFWSHRRLRSWYDLKVMCVRMATMSKYCHIGTAYVMGGRVWVLESVTPHPRLVPLSNLLPCDWAPMQAPWQPETEAFALSLIGNEAEVYSEWEAVKGFLGRVAPGKDHRWMCAEFAWLLAQKDNIDAGSDITPSGMADRAMEISSLTTLVNMEISR